jgi:L-alanine-DL-glutamate epimerase-like enolase superfamily enzyme
MSFSDAPVIRVDLMQCRVPLPAPVTLGPVEIRFRDYVSLRLVFADGSEGHATGFERGMPLFDIAARMAPLCLGRGSGERIAVRDTQLTPAPASRPVHLRGISLCNIAFWDGFCRQVGRPLWAVLGGARDRVPLMPVIGYGATPERVAAQAADLADRGFRIIKLMIDGTDFATDRALIGALAGALPDGVSFGIDGHWSWRTPAQALPTCRLAQDHGAVFVEDPFTPSQWRAIAQLQEKIDVPLAVGEDVIDRHGFRDLAEVAPILRPDASASGGIDGLMEAVTLAATHDRSVIPHVFPALHAHAGFASRVVTCVESILPEIGADPIDRFFAHAPRVEDGDLHADGVPGAGTALRWDDLAALATRTQTFS